MQTYLIVSHNQDFIEEEIKKLKELLSVLPYNLHELVPEKPIGIDQVRKLKKILTQKPYGGGDRLVIIKSMEKATTEAANALLKLLEEPPKKTYITLTTGNAHALLPTIISRCQIIREKTACQDFLQETKEVEEVFKKILTTSIGERILLSQKLAKSKEDVLELLDSFIILFRQMLHSENSRGEELNLTLKEIAALIKKTTSAKRYIERNVNYKATLDILFLGFPKVSA